MTERTEIILFFVMATFFIVVFIAVLLLYRHTRGGRSSLAEPGSLEAFRAQNDAEHGRLQALLLEIREDLARILARLGFLRK